ncbi:hypothetical protein F2P81_017494 [Scophthalmus maximus]|uniref:Uncharacterized protein n=1 Tax=Scophthalmus maximus TaxID=52904 RepID=A0A6A4S900_SCOMX|nr:hypothetical protein F2P81_017494 [Scophthalmus maximus]
MVTVTVTVSVLAALWVSVGRCEAPGPRWCDSGKTQSSMDTVYDPEHGATVLLYHPCSPLGERRLLSVLSSSCLSDYVMTPHPQLSRHKPIALVSWGRTLELSTVASSDVCDWLETTTTIANGRLSGAKRIRTYDLLLTRSAAQRRLRHTHPEDGSANMTVWIC